MSIRDVTDTARWVAAYRADESRRADALFHDPWAERLAGERGRAIVAAMPGGRAWGWPMVVRTKVMDDWILREVAAGADTVVNLAAGLDMRPYRLDLPAALRWFELDLPAILAEKSAAVADARPRCALERVALDLADETARRAALARIGAGARRVAFVSEGLLLYLAPEHAASLARDLAAVPGSAAWVLDLASPRVLRGLMKKWARIAAGGGAPFRFAPAEGSAFFAPHGWREREWRGALEESWRLKRAPAVTLPWRLMYLLASRSRRESLRRYSGFAVLERAA